MTRPSVPPALCQEETHLLGAFERVAEAAGVTASDALRAFKMLPPDLKNAPAFLDRLSGKWLYEFVPPIDRLDGGLQASGHFLPVHLLLLAIRRIDELLPAIKIVSFLNRLGDRDKHLDTMAELLPLASLKDRAPLEHEPADSGEDNRPIDWRIQPVNGTRPLLIEVKHRVLDLVQTLQQAAPAIRTGAKELGAPVPDVSRLFKDTAEKFRRADRGQVLQGAWVFCPIRVLRRDLESYFAGVDAERLHFAMLLNWDVHVWGLWRAPEDREDFFKSFALEESEDFFRDEGGTT